MDLTSKKLSRTTVIEIPFHDIDVLEVAWHGHYIKYAEIARNQLLSSINYDYPEMKASGYAWPIIEIKFRYIRPATYGMKLSVTATLVEVDHRLCIHYLMCNEQGQRICKGHSIQVAVDIKKQTMCLASPEIFLDLIATHLKT